MKCDKYIGFDLHQATTVVAVLDADGKVAMETIVATEAAAIIRFLKSLSGRLLSIKLCLRTVHRLPSNRAWNIALSCGSTEWMR